MKGDIIIPREEGKGIFFSKEVVGDYDFFTLKGRDTAFVPKSKDFL